ncbi:MAG: amino acid permease [Euryarchaeota archaeon]|nr:amino acid permease [Euryarchaeota archaeon]
MATGEEEVAEVEVKFRRDLGLRDIVMIGLGPTIGTTIFLLVGPGRDLAGPALLLVFVLNFVITIFTAMAYAELSSAFPETGGGYLWVKTAFSERVGFLGGWLGWFGHCIVCAFYVVSFGLYVVLFAEPLLVTWSDGAKDALVKGLSLAVLVAFIYVNYRGTRTTGKSSNVVTLTLIAIVLAYVVAGLLWFGRNPASISNFSPFLPSGGYGPAVSILMAMGLTFVVFEGYEIIAQTGEEVREPERNIPRANWITLSVATTIFVLVGFVTIAGLPATDQDAFTPFAVAHGAQEFFGAYPQVGLALIVLGVSLGSFAALNSLIFSSSRVAFAMGRDGAMPRMFGRLNRHHRTPAVAIFASGLVIGAMIAGLNVIQIAASADLMFLLLFTLVNAAAIRLRQTHPHLPRKYRMPFFPLVPLVGLGTKGLLAISLYLVDPTAWAIGAAWVVLGLGVYYLWAKRERIAEVARAVEAVLPLPEERYKVLVPLEDFNDAALVRFAALVARVEDGNVTLLNVVEVPPALPIDAIDSLYLLEVRMGLGRAVRVAKEAGVDARSKVVVSRRASEAILESVREAETDLVVAGWKGAWRGGRILGTNIDRLVQNAPCDVVVLKSAGLKERIERILVFNAPAWHVSYATGYAILLAKQHGASITIYTAATTDEEMDKEKVYSARLALMCRTHGIPYEEKFAKVRNIVDAVVEEAKGYDLLAVGASEEWAKLEYAFGSVQDQIARRAPCPVLMVRKVRRKETAP